MSRAATTPSGQYAADLRHRTKPTAVQEIVAGRTAYTSTWRNSDGSRSVRRYATPQFYRTPAGTWSSIDPSISPASGKPGWWTSGANSWSVGFGPIGAQGGGIRFAVGPHTFGLTPQGVNDADQTPSVSGRTAGYTGVWPDVDIAEHVGADGVKEDLIIKGPGAPSTFSFRLSDATATPTAAGGLDVLADGERVGTVPAPTVTVAAAKQRKDQTAASKARLTVAGDVIQVSVSPDWLAGLPASAFPVVLDPTVGEFTPASSWVVSSVSNGGQTVNGVVQIGHDTAGSDWRAQAYVPAPAPPTAAPGEQPWQFVGVWLSTQCDCQLTGAPIYGLSGAASYSGIQAGQPLVTLGGPSATLGFFSIMQWDAAWTYLSGRTDGWWFGFGTPGTVAGDDGGGLGTIDTGTMFFEAAYAQQPNPTSITSPANGSVVSTLTPKFTAPAVTVEANTAIYYDFRVTASPDGTGTVIDSGWLLGSTLSDPVVWTAPAGSVHDGATYYVKVLTSITSIYSGDPNAPGFRPTASPAVSFTVRQRLGDGGPSPADTVGAPPAGTTTPSKGAPSPGVPAASETVNLLTGNLSMVVGSPNMQTVAGTAGPALTYNSAQSSVAKGGNYGLTAQYSVDPGTHTFTNPVVGQRTDAAVNTTWKGGSINAPIGGFGVTQGANLPFLVRWTGVLSLPAGTWKLGGLTNGAMRVYLNGSSTPTYDDWAGTASATSPGYGSATVSGAHTYQVKVESWVAGTAGIDYTVQLWAKNTDITDPGTTSEWVVPSGWLTPTSTGVPPGWSLLANPATAQWVHADDEGSQVVLQGASGQTATFTRTAPGYYQAMPGNNDHLNVDGNQHLQLATADNQLYTFNADGSLAAMTSATDDRHPSALQYIYSGTPALLRGITDPVSGRVITLSYGPDAACPTTNPAPTGMLCKIAYWDGTATTFGYNGNGQIASVTNPGNQTVLLAYDSDDRLADIRDALAGAAVAAGTPAGTAVACPAGSTGLPVTPVDTQICYDSTGRVATVIQPAPTTGAARPARTYTYATDHTDTAIAGFSPASGYASRTTYDTQGRIIQQTDSSGHVTTSVWGNAVAAGNACTGACGSDLPIVTATPAGQQTSTVYDTNGNVTDVYGPAPLACFSGGWPASATPTAPVQGYLPVANPQGTAGCGIAAVPHTTNRYDEGMTGLAAAFWSNGQAAGTVTVHANGPDGTQPQTLCGATSGRLCAHWAAGAPPITSDASGHWTLRLTGTITLASTGTYNLGIASSQAMTVAYDGTPRVHDGPDVTGFVAGQTRTTSTNGVQFSAGVHTIQVDFQGSATQLNDFAVMLTPAPGTGGVILNSILGPGYRLRTGSTDPDGVVTTTSYTDSTVGPQYGLVTATTVGAGTGAALTTATSYEAPGTTTYLRKLSHTLPAGNATTYTYYTGTAGPLAAVCGVTASTPQGGLLQTQTDPAPTAATARVQQFIYDAAGRRAGRRVAASSSISTAPWQCTAYDAVGRYSSQTWPAFNGAAARTATYTYNVGGNPLVSKVVDPTGTVTTTVDLLGRLVSYTDTAGKVSGITYNQAGQVTATSGPQGAVSNTYNANSGSLATVTVGGTLLATTHDDPGTGRLSSVTYANGTTGTLGYDTYGNQNSLVFTTTAAGALVAGDQTTLSAGKRITRELEDINGTALTNPNPAGSTATTYTYDGAGRLATAYLPGAAVTYGYAANPVGDNCTTPGAGANANRTSVTVTPTGGSASSIHNCYNTADQLVSSITGTGTNTQYAYDAHGNQTNNHGTTLTWDAADRLATVTPSGGGTTGYSYDALDRVASHTAGGTTVRYAYAAFGDSPVATLDGAGTVLQQLIMLPGGVLVTVQSSGEVWSYPDLRGNVTVTANNTGVRLNTPVTYDPWGTPTAGSATLGNATGGNVFGAFGANSKLTDTTLGITLLGARAYQASDGRFLSVDPVEGGCANNYVYVFGDPLNKNDLTGRNVCEITIEKDPRKRANVYWGSVGAASGAGAGYGGVRAGHALFKGGSMGWRAAGSATGLGSLYGDFMFQYITTGKYDWCEGLIFLVGGLLAGAAFA
ncbi:RHS repeat-associated core domain-containing protein [Dactylosporangium sp. CA-152071]|uniref:RHS repeat domain-containing protein n=1 Tax=Dactylosporangium sp. CA-152071 TaxID=3239933 RepID=UPI003D8C26FE